MQGPEMGEGSGEEIQGDGAIKATSFLHLVGIIDRETTARETIALETTAREGRLSTKGLFPRVRNAVDLVIANHHGGVQTDSRNEKGFTGTLFHLGMIVGNAHLLPEGGSEHTGTHRPGWVVGGSLPTNDRRGSETHLPEITKEVKEEIRCLNNGTFETGEHLLEPIEEMIVLLGTSRQGRESEREMTDGLSGP